jgi:hypothetical protein
MIALMLLTQTYLLAYLMLAPLAVLLLIFRRWIPWKALLAGGAIFAAASLAYGAGLLRQIDTLQQEVSSFASAPAHLNAEAWNHAVRLISGADYPLARGHEAPLVDWALRQDLTQIAHYGILLLLLAGLLLALNALRSGLRRDSAAILLVWFGLPVLLMSNVGQRVHPFYLLLTLPAGYALVGWTFAALPGPRWRTGLAALLVPFSLLMIVNSQRFAQETAAHPGADDLGALPLNVGMQLSRLIKDHLPPEGIVYAEVDEWTLNSLAGTTFPLLRDTRAPGFSIVPRSGGIYVYPHASLPSDWSGPCFTTIHERLTLADGVVLTVDAYPVDAVQQVLPQHVLKLSSEDGLTLLGYDLERPTAASPAIEGTCPALAERGIRLTTYWQVEALQPETAAWYFAPFVQVYDAAGTQLSVIQGAMVPGREWRTGDVHVQRMLLPPEAASVRIGQYDGSRQRNLIFLPDYTPLIDIPVA